MMKISKSSKRLNLLALFLSFLMMVGTVTPVYAGGLETLNTHKDNFLDRIENVMRDTGLGDWRDKIEEDYGVKITPYFKTRFDITSNVFKAPDTDSDHTDQVWSFIPGVQWTWKNKYGVIGGAYEAIFKYFTEFSQQNEQDQKFLVYANLFPTEKTYIRLTEKFDQVGATAGSSAFEPVNYFDNTVSVVTGYKANDKWSFEFGYENFDRDFSGTIARRYSYNEDKYDYRVFHKLNDKTRLYSGIRLGKVNFSKTPNRDTFYYEFPLGFEATLPSGINVVAAVGLHHRNLEADDRNDITHVVTNIALRKGFNRNRTTLSGGFLRRPVESSFSTTTTYDEKLWYVDAKHLITSKLRSRANIYAGDRDWEERVLVGTRVVAGGAVFVVNPQTVKRDDKTWGFGLGFDYNMRKWWVLHMDYQLSRRNSNISALDYTENVFSLRSTIRV